MAIALPGHMPGQRAGITPRLRRSYLMPAFLMQLVNSIKAVWARMSVMQRVMVMGGFVLIGSAAIGLSV